MRKITMSVILLSITFLSLQAFAITDDTQTVGLWRMDETNLQGNAVLDDCIINPNRNNHFWFGASGDADTSKYPSIVAGGFDGQGNALSFNPANLNQAYFAWGGYDSMRIEFWFKPTVQTSPFPRQELFWLHDALRDVLFLDGTYSTSSGDVTRLKMQHGNVVTPLWFSIPYDGKWRYVVAEWGQDTAMLSVDGVVQTADVSSSPFVQRSRDLLVGKDNWSQRFYDGLLDQVKVSVPSEPLIGNIAIAEFEMESIVDDYVPGSIGARALFVGDGSNPDTKPTQATGYDGDGLYFDGVDDVSSTYWDGHDNLEMSLWFKADVPEGANPEQTIWSLYYPQLNNNRIELRIYGTYNDSGMTGNTRATLFLTAPGNPLAMHNTGCYVPFEYDGQWKHLTLQVSQDGAFMSIGELSRSVELEEGQFPALSGRMLFGRLLSVSRPFAGVMDNISMSAFYEGDDPYPWARPYNDDWDTIGLWKLNEPALQVGSRTLTPDYTSVRGQEYAIDLGVSGFVSLGEASYITADPNAVDGFGKCAYLDGGGFGFWYSDTAILPNDNLRLEAWAKLDVDPDQEVYHLFGIFANGEYGNALKFRIVHTAEFDGSFNYLPDESTFRLFATIQGDSGTTGIWGPFLTYDQVTDWNHYAYENVDGSLVLYLNGIQVSASPFIAPMGSGGRFGIGTFTDVYASSKDNSAWRGWFDEIRISHANPIDHCGKWAYLAGDVNQDCSVDIDDLAIIADDWLSSTLP